MVHPRHEVMKKVVNVVLKRRLAPRRVVLKVLQHLLLEEVLGVERIIVRTVPRSRTIHEAVNPPVLQHIHQQMELVVNRGTVRIRRKLVPNVRVEHVLPKALTTNVIGGQEVMTQLVN